MIVLFTDFGTGGPYVGQVKAVLARAAPGIPVIDLMHDVPAFDARAGAYLLSALSDALPADAVFLGVVDPGVGGARAAIVVEADGRRFVGPDNGLYEIVLRRAGERRAWSIAWRPERLSASFHGRDLFAPVAARIARGEDVPGTPLAVDQVRRPDWPEDLAEIVYVDGYGNAMTGIRVAVLAADAVIEAAGRRLARARTFSEAPRGAPFWYENANGLAEIALDRGSAAATLGLTVGMAVGVAR